MCAQAASSDCALERNEEKVGGASGAVRFKRLMSHRKASEKALGDDSASASASQPAGGGAAGGGGGGGGGGAIGGAAKLKGLLRGGSSRQPGKGKQPAEALEESESQVEVLAEEREEFKIMPVGNAKLRKNEWSMSRFNDVELASPSGAAISTFELED